MNSVPIELGSCWAKTDASGSPALTLRDHSLVVGMVAEVLLEIIFPYLKKRFPPGAVTLAALHDVGKLTLGFLFKCPAWKEQWRARGMDVDRLQNSCGQHAWISQQVIEELGVSKLWAISIGGHHGKFANPLQAGKERSGSARLCRPLRMELISILSDIFGALEVLRHPPDRGGLGG